MADTDGSFPLVLLDVSAGKPLLSVRAEDPRELGAMEALVTCLRELEAERHVDPRTRLRELIGSGTGGHEASERHRASETTGSPRLIADVAWALQERCPQDIGWLDLDGRSEPLRAALLRKTAELVPGARYELLAACRVGGALNIVCILNVASKRLVLSMLDVPESELEDIGGVNASEKPPSAAPAEVSGLDASSLGEAASALWQGRAATFDLDQPFSGALYVACRAKGKALGSTWAEGESILDALRRAIRSLIEQLGDKRRRSVDTLEIVIASGYRKVTGENQKKRLSNLHRGLRGIEISSGNTTARYAPTQMLASNRDFKNVVERFVEEHGRGPVRLRTFESTQMLVSLKRPRESVQLFRGSRVVPIEAVTHKAVDTLAHLQTGWLFDNLGSDGRMVYKYWPSSGEESSANNMIRQWMATVAMGRAARRQESQELFRRVASNIRYNLTHFYEERDGLGCIIEDGTKIKLGAVALACLALVEHPDRPEFAAQEQALRRTVDHLWQEDGSFVTFLLPEGRNDNHNFYPGEALLLWSFLYAENRDAALLERFMASFRYYRAWHIENRNPAFIPWHTQAYRRVWSITGDPELAQFILVMNDWLLPVQQWEGQEQFPDIQGRFYDPARPFGPPHASSTGVYLEGLIDAWRVARALRDGERQERYRQAIVRGLRSTAQLTFKDDIDMFYVAQREKVKGGVRTTVYNNEIRVDNVQHNLMAIFEILEEFSPEDFRP